MAKTNYTKVEEALAEGMRKIEVNRLLDIADETAAANSTTPLAIKESDKKSKKDIDPTKLLNSLDHDIKALQKLGKDPFRQLGIDKEEIIKFINNPSILTPEDLNKIKSLKTKLEEYRSQIEKNVPKSSDEDIVKQQRKKQVTKRFNINDKWIPLQ